MTVRTVVVDAPAKINLFLRVRGRRDDGYHELETLFQSVSLADRVTVAVAGWGVGVSGDRSGRGPIALEVVGAELGPAEENLAHRAADRILAETGSTASVRIRLDKRIPAGAGLGGGSSDAAAVLRCLAHLLAPDDLPGRPIDDALLRRVASEVGSDVPFFLEKSPLATGRGRGEVLTSHEPLPAAALVLALPPVHVSTADAFRALAASRSGAGGLVGSGAPATAPPGSSWAEVLPRFENDFEPLVAERHPEVRTSLDALRDSGAEAVLLSGSGAASFGFFRDTASARAASDRLSSRCGWPFLAVETRTTATPVQPLESGT